MTAAPAITWRKPTIPAHRVAALAARDPLWRWTPGEDGELAALWREGVSLEDIAERMGRDADAVAVRIVILGHYGAVTARGEGSR